MSGAGGIRTHDALRHTRFPSERTRPDYATAPPTIIPRRFGNSTIFAPRFILKSQTTATWETT